MNASGSSDDVVTVWSSRGPSPAGRKKPDIVAIGGGDGVGNMSVVEQRWQPSGLNRLTRGDTGTSFASPAVAGGAALLAGLGITDPMARKAILLNSTTLGRATPSDPMGTQVAWQPDWGWGEMNLTQAYGERGNWQAGSVEAGKAKLYKMTPQATTDRATLAWQRRVESCFVVGCGSKTTHTLTNLDLYAYDLNTQVLEASSTSAIDNVEQVRAQDTSAAPDLLKVKANSTVDGVPAEPFAIDGTRALAPVTAPEPNATIQSVTPTNVKPGELVTVTATIANPSTDLTAPSFSATGSGAGVEIVSAPSSLPTQLGKKNTAGDTTTLTWTVRAPSDGTYSFTIQGQAQSYGETWTGAPATATFTVDGTPPSPSITSPDGESCTPALPVTWGATDPSGVSRYDVDVRIDGGLFAGWLPGTTTTGGTFTGSLGHSYGFRVRATDQLGNSSMFVDSPTSSVVSCDKPAPPTDNPRPRLNPRMRLTRTLKRGSALYLRGELARSATGYVEARYTNARHRRVKVRARVGSGRFALKLTVRRHSRMSLTLSYLGDSRHLPATLRRTVRTR
jgi:hypothetical protein